jgi:iron complex transport system substrate-binding protein
MPRHHHQNLSRRSLLRSGLAVPATVVLATTVAACGDSGSSASGDPSGPSGPDATAAPDAGAFPRTVEHELGTTEIATAPQRIVCGTDGAELCSLLALGLVPVGFGQRNDPLQPWLGDLADGIDTYDLSSGETSYEALAAWSPDVILVQNGFATTDTMPRFTDIAPTIATSFIDWRDNLRQVASAVGLDGRAAELEQEQDDAVAAIAETLSADLGDRAAGLRVRALSTFSDGSVYVFNADSPLGKTCEALGFDPLPPSRTPGEALDQLSLEELGSVDGDLLLLMTFDPEDNGNAQLADNGLYQRLDAVRAGNVVEVVGPDADQLYFDAVLTVEPNARLLADLVRDALA